MVSGFIMPAVRNFPELHIIKIHFINLKHQEMAFYTAVKSVKGSGNSAFLQKDQLFYLKTAEKINFLHLFIIEHHTKLLPYLLILVD